MKLSFVTETVAYDMGTLCEVAHELGLEEHDAILQTFLELDRATARRTQERALVGVRKAQAKLAAYYLNHDDREHARLIFHDMENDPPERLMSIHQELERVETKDFWEIIDRGRNFEFMGPAQKDAMRRFFTWFQGADSESVPNVVGGSVPAAGGGAPARGDDAASKGKPKAVGKKTTSPEA
jgi:hypothetical protein